MQRTRSKSQHEKNYPIQHMNNTIIVKDETVEKYVVQTYKPTNYKLQ